MEAINIPAAVLREMAKFIDPRDVRYYLHGVYVETGSFGARLTATDGHALARYRADHTARPARAVIVPVAGVKTATKGGGKNAVVTIELDEAGRAVTMRNGAVVVTATPIYGEYPDLARVIPSVVSGEPAVYNPEYIARAAGFIGAANPAGRSGTGAVLHQNGKNPAVMRGESPDAFVLVMPRRETLDEFDWPIQEAE